MKLSNVFTYIFIWIIHIYNLNNFSTISINDDTELGLLDRQLGWRFGLLPTLCNWIILEVSQRVGETLFPF